MRDSLPLDCQVSTPDKIACLKREIKYRARVYPRLIADRRMSQDTADREIEIMRAILNDYELAQKVVDRHIL